jgi:hypothetical protein
VRECRWIGSFQPKLAKSFFEGLLLWRQLSQQMSSWYVTEYGYLGKYLTWARKVVFYLLLSRPPTRIATSRTRSQVWPLNNFTYLRYLGTYLIRQDFSSSSISTCIYKSWNTGPKNPFNPESLRVWL